MSPLSQLKEKIYAACPELKEPSFGCRFQFPNGGALGTFLNSKEWKRAKFLVNLVDLPPHYDELKWDDFEGVELLGKPIELAHVLRAINFKLPSGHWVTTAEYLCFYEADTDNELCIWNLSKDLSGQSPETVQFLLDILS